MSVPTESPARDCTGWCLVTVEKPGPTGRMKKTVRRADFCAKHMKRLFGRSCCICLDYKPREKP